MAVVNIYKGIGKNKGTPLKLNEGVYTNYYFNNTKFKSIYQNSNYNVGDILIKSIEMATNSVITLYSDDNNINIINTYTGNTYELKDKNIRSITISKRENFSLNEHFLGKEGKSMLLYVSGPFVLMFLLIIVLYIYISLQETKPTKP